MSTLFAINTMKINRTTPDKHKYLSPLVHIAQPPKAIFYSGTLPEQRRPTVAIVGTRRPSRYGQEVTHLFASELARQGVVIVSGLALGVDAIAHRAALEANGTTIAVLGNGLPTIYPASHRQLGYDIMDRGGAILSEYEPETPARNYRFLERNRIVSGIADAILITEAAARSGTLNTTMHALEQGKEVFVVPGNITSPLSAGCNTLLRQGAAPATSVEDILSIIAPDTITDQPRLPLGTTAEETTIIQLIQSGIRDGDELQQASGIEASLFSTTLTMLELAGVIRPLGSNQWTLR